MRNKRLALIVAAVALMAVPGTMLADTTYTASLTGTQEVGPVATTATGQGTAIVSTDGLTITYTVTYTGLSGPVTAAHIHTGAAGVAGGVIFPFTTMTGPAAGTLTGTLTTTNFTASGAVTTFAQAVTAIAAGTTYFNLHTAANPGGEIRGQILAAAAASASPSASASASPSASASASPSPTPTATVAPTAAPTEEPTAAPTLPTTSAGSPVGPSDDGMTMGLLVLAGLAAAAGTLLYIGRRRSSEQR